MIPKTNEGRMGAVNGMRPDGRVDRTTIQSMEVSRMYALPPVHYQTNTIVCAHSVALHHFFLFYQVWTGTTFALAACMLAEGMPDEAFRTAKGLCRSIYGDLGYWFQTPEVTPPFSV